MLHDGVVIVMPENVDAGNPNVFTVFKGKYDLTPAAGVSFDSVATMKTCVNNVQFMGDAVIEKYVEGDVFATLHEECKPDHEVKCPIVWETSATPPDIQLVTFLADGSMVVAGDSEGVGILTINEEGKMMFSKSAEKLTLHTRGVLFNVSNVWYY